MPSITTDNIGYDSHVVSLALVTRYHSDAIVVTLAASPNRLFTVIHYLIVIVIGILVSLHIITNSVPTSHGTTTVH